MLLFGSEYGLDRMRLAFIGGGTMAEAILKGVLASGLAGPGDISVGEPRADRREFLAKEYGVKNHPGNPEAAAEVDQLRGKPEHVGRSQREIDGGPEVFDYRIGCEYL